MYQTMLTHVLTRWFLWLCYQLLLPRNRICLIFKENISPMYTFQIPLRMCHLFDIAMYKFTWKSDKHVHFTFYLLSSILRSEIKFKVGYTFFETALWSYVALQNVGITEADCYISVSNHIIISLIIYNHKMLAILYYIHTYFTNTKQ